MAQISHSSSCFSKETLMEDLELVFVEALKKQKYKEALRAKELQGRLMGLFERVSGGTLRLEALTDQELDQLILRFEAPKQVVTLEASSARPPEESVCALTPSALIAS